MAKNFSKVKTSFKVNIPVEGSHSLYLINNFQFRQNVYIWHCPTRFGYVQISRRRNPPLACGVKFISDQEFPCLQTKAMFIYTVSKRDCMELILSCQSIILPNFKMLFWPPMSIANFLHSTVWNSEYCLTTKLYSMSFYYQAENPGHFRHILPNSKMTLNKNIFLHHFLAQKLF